MTFFDVVEHLSPIYKRDTRGEIRVWEVQIGENKSGEWAYRVISGLVGGERVISEWKKVSPKNVGRANQTTARQQAYIETDALYKKKRDRGYFDNPQDVDKFDKFKPMLATGFEKVRDIDYGQFVYSQPKLDGIRCIVRADGMWTRAGKPIVSCPHVFGTLKPFFEKFPKCVLDGELYNHDLKDDFNKITSMVRRTTNLSEGVLAETASKVQYHVYDFFDHELPSMRFRDRLQFLGGNLVVGKVIQMAPTTRVRNHAELGRLYSEYLEDGYEGQIIRLDAPYENKRSKFLIKRKEFLSDEFPVVAVEEGQGNWAGYAKRFVLRLPDGQMFGAGVRGTQDALKALYEAENKPTWATVRYFTPTPEGIPRFPVVVDYGHGERCD